MWEALTTTPATQTTITRQRHRGSDLAGALTVAITVSDPDSGSLRFQNPSVAIEHNS
ncbi:hypothetical protein L915_10219, partial [Phytophthora nicotianae]